MEKKKRKRGGRHVRYRRRSKDAAGTQIQEITFSQDVLDEAAAYVEKKLSGKIRRRLSREKIRIDYLSNGERHNISEPDPACRTYFFRMLRYHPERFFMECMDGNRKRLSRPVAYRMVRQTYPQMQGLENMEIRFTPEWKAARHMADEQHVDEQILEHLKEAYPFETMLTLLGENPGYRQLVHSVRAWMEKDRKIKEAVLESIPSDPVALYTNARKMQRHFVLHIGPTNSGKTKAALDVLEQAQDGVYLAPLRLMAYEAHEKINHDGVPCSMITGEERIDVPGNNLWAMTIEMLDISEEYEVAVIDEAQMCTQRERGGSWTRAILGTAAKEIHVCAAPEAEGLLIRLIESCEDTYEIVRHERLTPLEHDDGYFTFPQSVQEGDALIVFTAKSARFHAARLEKRGIPCSIIYGKLPYEARHSEAARFSSGETKVLVATDAIGMGLNLPIRRIVFLETIKFDGKQTRTLDSSEVKQIAGRAGRYGRYPTGYYMAAGDENDRIHALYEEPVPAAEVAVLGFPDDLRRIEANPSDVISHWISLPAMEGYRKSDLEEMLELARHFEKKTDDKELIYAFSSMPASCDSRNEMQVLNRAFRRVSNAGMLDTIDFDFIDLPQTDDTEWHLRDLCTQYDLANRCLRRFGTWEDAEEMQRRRKDAANLVAEKVKDKI